MALDTMENSAGARTDWDYVKELIVQGTIVHDIILEIPSKIPYLYPSIYLSISLSLYIYIYIYIYMYIYIYIHIIDMSAERNSARTRFHRRTAPEKAQMHTTYYESTE